MISNREPTFDQIRQQWHHATHFESTSWADTMVAPRSTHENIKTDLL
jgi:hypothetical protein